MEETTESRCINEFFAALERGDIDGVFELATDDIEFTPIGTHAEFGRTFRGKQDIVENCWLPVFARLKDGGVQLTRKSQATGDGIGFRESAGQGISRSGMPYNNSYVHVFRFRDGKVCSVTEYLDTALFYELMEE